MYATRNLKSFVMFKNNCPAAHAKSQTASKCCQLYISIGSVTVSKEKYETCPLSADANFTGTPPFACCKANASKRLGGESLQMSRLQHYNHDSLNHQKHTPQEKINDTESWLRVIIHWYINECVRRHWHVRNRCTVMWLKLIEHSENKTKTELGILSFIAIDLNSYQAKHMLNAGSPGLAFWNWPLGLWTSNVTSSFSRVKEDLDSSFARFSCNVHGTPWRPTM